MRVCFKPERRTPSAVPGQITGCAGTSVWHAQSDLFTNNHSEPSKTTHENKDTSSSQPIKLTHNTPEHIVCHHEAMEPNLDSSVRISENYDYINDRRHFPLSIGGHFQHFRDSEELYEPGSFRTEWLVWRRDYYLCLIAYLCRILNQILTIILIIDTLKCGCCVI